MITIVEVSTQTKLAGTNFIDLTLPNSGVIDDYYLIIVTNDRGGTNITINQPGYTEAVTQYRYNTCRTAIFYKKIDGTELDPRVNGNSSSEFSVEILVLRGVDLTTFLEFSVQNDNVLTYNGDCPGGTTTVNECLILRGVFFDNQDLNAISFCDGLGNQLPLIYTVGTAFQYYLSYNNQDIAGLVDPVAIGVDNNDSFSFTLAIRPNTAITDISPSIESNCLAIDNLGARFLSDPSVNINTASSLITTINGVTVDTTTPALSAETTFDEPLTLQVDFGARSINAELFIGAYINLSQSYNFSNLVYSIEIKHTDIGQINDLGLIHLFFDSANNWAAFAPTSKTAFPQGANYNMYFSPSVNTALDSGGVIDWTDINKIGWGYIESGSNLAVRGTNILNPCLLGNIIYAGFSDLSPTKIGEILAMGNSPTRSSLQGIGQSVLFNSLQIGNGIKQTNYSQSTNSLEYPANNNTLYTVEQSGFKTITVYASDNDIIDFSSSILATERQENFTFHPSTSAIATYRFNGCSIIGFLVTLQSVITLNRVSFLRCPTIDVKGATLNNSNFSESISTNACATITDGANIINGEFTQGLETYAIEITTAGDYDFSGTSFNNYTTVINVTATTGDVNITSDIALTFNTAGANVNFIAGANLEFTNIVPGTLIRAYVGSGLSATIIASIESSGSTFLFSHEEAGNQGFVIFSEINFEPLRIDLTYSSEDQSIPIFQQENPTYNNP